MNPFDLSSTLWPVLTRASLQGSVALVAVFVICRIFARIPAAAKCWLWRLAWLRVIFAFATGATLSLPLLTAPRSAALAAPLTETSQAAPMIEATPIASVAPIAATQLIDPIDAVVLIWAFGVLLMIARLAVHFCAAIHIRRTGAQRTSDLLIQLSAAFKVRRPMLLISEHITKPLLTGVFKPAIILPASINNADPRTLELIFKHELAHLKRRDLAWNWLAAIAHTLFWFNPLTWLCEREANFNQEVACDQLALRDQTSRAAEFASLLIDIAANRDRTPQLLTVSIIRSRTTLERRLTAMKSIRTKGSFISIALALLALTPALIPWRAIAQKSDAAAPAAETKTEPAAPKNGVEEELLAEEIKLARQQLDATTRAREQGRASFADVLQRQREFLHLERELAIMQKDFRKTRELLQEELKGVEQLQREATKQVEVGVISSDEKLKIDREVLKLKRELAGLDRNREEVNPGTASMMYYMQNPELMKRYFPQMYAKMMESSGTNAPGLSESSAEKLRAAKDELAMLQLKYSEKHPAVTEAKNKVARLERSLPMQELQMRLLAQAQSPRVALRPKRAGVVRWVHVKPGDRVAEGQNLMQLDDGEANLRLQGAEAEFAMTEADIKLQQRPLMTERKQLEELKLTDAQRAERDELIELNGLKWSRLQSQLQLAKTKMEQARLEFQERIIRAPGDGVVLSVPLVGQSVSPDASVIEFVPAPPEAQQKLK
jgi:beta-lactamase regulating signal transducer with metallopeptidase domain